MQYGATGTLLLIVMPLWQELTEIRAECRGAARWLDGVQRYVGFWNVLALCNFSCIVFTVCTFLSPAAMSEFDSRGVCALSLLLAWFYFLHYLRCFEDTADLVQVCHWPPYASSRTRSTCMRGVAVCRMCLTIHTGVCVRAFKCTHAVAHHDCG